VTVATPADGAVILEVPASATEAAP
jgi:hypothetical protein